MPSINPPVPSANLLVPITYPQKPYTNQQTFSIHSQVSTTYPQFATAILQVFIHPLQMIGPQPVATAQPPLMSVPLPHVHPPQPQHILASSLLDVSSDITSPSVQMGNVNDLSTDRLTKAFA